MTSLWFKQEYVASIMNRDKIFTMRAWIPPGISAGSVVGLSVGPRRPFARALISAVTPVTLDELDADYRQIMKRLYPGRSDFFRLDFTLI